MIISRRQGIIPGDILQQRIFMPRPTTTVGGDWWDPNNDGLCIWAAYQPKGAANYASSKLDLSGNGHHAAEGVAPGWDAVNGWAFNQSTHYLTTTFVPASDQTQTMIAQFSNVATGVADYVPMCGVIGGTGNRRFELWPNYANTARYSNGQLLSGGGPHASGNMAIAGSVGYYNGVSAVINIATWASSIVYSVWIGTVNNQGSGLFYNDGTFYMQTFAIYDCTLTGPQVAAVAAAMAAL